MSVGKSTLRTVRAVGLAICAAVTAVGQPVAASDVVNVYSSRERELTEPLLGIFENLTNIRPNLVNVPKGLIERIAREGKSSPADVILTKDLSELVAAKKAGITRPVIEPFLRERMPVTYRDPSGHWFGLTKRARVALVSRRRAAGIKALTYEELGDPEWRGRLCMPSGGDTSNIGLFASLVAHMGPGWTGRWLKDVKRNQARRPSGGDKDQILLVEEGKCDLALVNSHQLGSMLINKRKANLHAAAKAVHLIFPNANDRGSHISVTGMAMMKHARNPEVAVVLMDFLTSKPAQFIYAQDFAEYPIRDDVDPSPLVRSWGKLKAERLLMSDIVRYEEAAKKLVSEVEFDKAR